LILVIPAAGRIKLAAAFESALLAGFELTAGPNAKHPKNRFWRANRS
jgi:hypothetical protein